MARARKPVLALAPGSKYTIFQNREGWQGELVVGFKSDGREDRRKRRGKDEADVLAKLVALQKQCASQELPKAGKPGKLADLLADYLVHDNAEWRYNTVQNSYGWAINNWVVPGLGQWRTDILEQRPDVLEKFFKSIARKKDDPLGKGLSPASVHLVFRVLRAGLNWAKRAGRIGRNPIDYMTWKPPLKEKEVTPLFVEEIQAIIEVCLKRPNGTRYIIGLTLGLRQGEALGLTWLVPAKSTKDTPMGLDLKGWLVIRQQTERRKWEHGCDDPHACAKRHCRTVKCPPRYQHGCGKDPAECTKNRVDRCPQRQVRPGCARHRDPDNCGDLCPKLCVGHAKACPKRANGGIVFVDTKSDAGHRRVALAPQMIPLAMTHKINQDRERAAAGADWEDLNLVWCQPNGKPIDARADWEEWKEICRIAGVRESRLHDGRHAAATMLLLLGVDEQTVMAIMGWSDRRMVQRYQHVIDDLRQQASNRIGTLLWGPAEPGGKAQKAPKSDRDRKAGKRKKKSENKHNKQPKLTLVDEAVPASTTKATTSDTLAKIIPLRPSA